MEVADRVPHRDEERAVTEPRARPQERLDLATDGAGKDGRYEEHDAIAAPALDGGRELSHPGAQRAVVEVARLVGQAGRSLEAGLVRRLDGDQDDLGALDHLLHRAELDAAPGEQLVGAGLAEGQPSRLQPLVRTVGRVVRNHRVAFRLDRERDREPQFAQPSDADVQPETSDEMPDRRKERG